MPCGEVKPNSGKKMELALLLWCSFGAVVCGDAYCTYIFSSGVPRLMCVYPLLCCSEISL